AAPVAAVEPPAGRAAAALRKNGPEGEVPAVMPA
ncbi:redox-sensing transcriptional repressor Rex, partial [Streptomyces sp. SID7760]|nr:redox-sensing transcriptional repressor Rex [Streptomyces sp. SID7760]